MGAPEEVEVEMGTPEEALPEEASPEEECVIPNGLLKNLLVATSIGAGGIHLWAGWAHSGITRVMVFFVVVGALQLWSAAAVIWVRSIPWSFLIGSALVNAGVVVVWVLSRTTGVPFQPRGSSSMDEIMNNALANPGPSSGFMVHSETFGLPDTTAAVLQIVFVAAVVMLLLRKRRSARVESDDETVEVGA